ncbi:MAG: 2-hydroxychromene-2-carboxylate isomerase [Candidatus Binatia bacterium]
MGDTVDYYFSFISLYSYIGSQAWGELVERRQLDVVYKPVDLMAVFAATGGLPVKQRSVARQAYRQVEMQRWRAARGIPLVLQPRFYPADPQVGHRMLLAALRDGREVGAFVHGSLQAVWAEEQNIADPDTLVRLADASGLDGRALLEASADPALAVQQESLTREAIARKVFGAPFYFWRDEPFWGQDRLEFLEAAIASGREPIPYREP